MPVFAAFDQVIGGAAGRRFDLGLTYDHEDVGFVSLKKHGTTLRQDVLEKAKTYDGIMLDRACASLRASQHWKGGQI